MGRWQREPALTAFRHDLMELIRGEGGVCVVNELPPAALAARGSGQEEPLRSRQALAVVRAAVEVELAAAEPRLSVRRVYDKVFGVAGEAASGSHARLSTEIVLDLATPRQPGDDRR